MIRKNRLSFSDISIEGKKEENRTNTHKVGHSSHTQVTSTHGAHAPVRQHTPHANHKPHTGDKKVSKSSTFQYSKFGKGRRSPVGSNAGGKPFISRNTITKIPELPAGNIRIIPLGGVEEIGKNMTAIEIGNDIIVIDAGMHFSTEETPGVDYVIPNTTYLEERKDKIRALFITHGHLDHIGGVPLVLSRIGNPPVYSRNLSILMMKKRAAEFPHLPEMKTVTVERDDVVTLGGMRIRFFGVTHTIPDSMGIIVETPHGWIVNPGDYKLDQIDSIVSDAEEKEYSIFDKAKVLLLMTDSTNIENEGFSLPEVKVHQGLENLMRKITGRMIIAAFASHITRLAFIVKAAEAQGKKIVLDGRSMKTNIEVAIEADYFKPKKDTIIPIEEIDNYPDNKIVILMTGAQGEEFASLNRVANKTHTKFKLKKGDTIVLSSSIIPGNERSIQKMKDGIARQGVRIIGYRTPGEDYVHATGHGNKEDVRWLHNKVHEKFFIPIHGYHYNLQLHKLLAMETGIPEENIIIPDNGSIIEISADGEHISARKEKAPSAPMMVDGMSVGDSTDVVIKDRQMLAQDGMFVIITVVDQHSGQLKKSPDLISRGFVYLKENQELLRACRVIIKKTIEDGTINNKNPDFDVIKNQLGENISKFLFQKTAKRPLVIPVILSI